MATEGNQYKYYKASLGSITYNANTDITKKPNISSACSWWLRSLDYRGSSNFCFVGSWGNSDGNYAKFNFDVLPGFAI